MKPIFKFKINLLRDIVYKNSNIEKQHTIRINNLIPSIKIAKKKYGGISVYQNQSLANLHHSHILFFLFLQEQDITSFFWMLWSYSDALS